MVMAYNVLFHPQSAFFYFHQLTQFHRFTDNPQTMVVIRVAILETFSSTETVKVALLKQINIYFELEKTSGEIRGIVYTVILE